MGVKVPSAIRRYAREDIDEILQSINSDDGDINAELVDISYQVIEGDPEDDEYSDDIGVIATAKINYGADPRYQIDFDIDYSIVGDDVFYGTDNGIEGFIEALQDKIANHTDSHPIEAATNSKKSRITAADEDFDDELLDEPDDFEDAIDDMADDIEDMQDSLDDVQEDDPNIEVENNIAGHYIAECEKCHGIFISAVCESDQEVEKITGVCPLCEKESDQYLRWVVHEIE